MDTVRWIPPYSWGVGLGVTPELRVNWTDQSYGSSCVIVYSCGNVKSTQRKCLVFHRSVNKAASGP